MDIGETDLPHACFRPLGGGDESWRAREPRSMHVRQIEGMLHHLRSNKRFALDAIDDPQVEFVLRT
jgi:hypothetical protein